MDRGTRKGESWIQPPGGSSGFQKELIAAPERVDRRFISVGSWNHIGWIVESEKVKAGFTPLGVVPRLKKSGSRNQKRVVLSSRKGESWFHLFWNPDRFPFAESVCIGVRICYHSCGPMPIWKLELVRARATGAWTEQVPMNGTHEQAMRVLHDEQAMCTYSSTHCLQKVLEIPQVL